MKSVGDLQSRPAFRKATRAMMLAFASIEDAIYNAGLTETLKSNPERFSLITSSSFGEIETTKDFLKVLADTGVARPILFQNSLHNSTTGFLSIQFRLSGPTLTFSHGTFAGEQALEGAELLLSQPSTDFIIVTSVETFVPELLATGIGEHALRENSTSFVFARPEVASTMRVQAEIGTIRCVRDQGGRLRATHLASPNCEVLHRLKKQITENADASGELKIDKPSVGYSFVEWRR